MIPEEYLSEFASGLNLTDAEREQISQKHNRLRDMLRDKLPVADDFLTGSYPRNTIIRPEENDKYDVDFFLAFSNDDYGEYELPELLEMVRDALEEIKSNNPDIVAISNQNRSIAVEYEDGFRIDVVPSIEIEKDRLYKIFDKRTRQPVESNPKLHGKILSESNEATESGSVRRLVPIIKLLKSWKRDKCDYVKSFHLELLAIAILKDEKIETYSYGLTKFFTKAIDYLKAPVLADPANEDNMIDAYLDEDGTREALLGLVAHESKIVEKASHFENDGDYENAVKEWKKIFEGDDKSRNTDNSKSNRVTIISNPPKQHYDDRVVVK